MLVTRNERAANILGINRLDQGCSISSPRARSCSQCWVIWPPGLPMDMWGVLWAVTLHARLGAQGNMRPNLGAEPLEHDPSLADQPNTIRLACEADTMSTTELNCP